MLALLALPSTAFAQRDAFFSAVVTFHRSLAGLYGDEGPRLTTQSAAMSTALDRWDSDIRDAEREMRSRLQSANDVQTRLQIHTVLASLYLERGRLNDALREFDEDISIDPRRAAFHRFKGLILQMMSRPADAAEAFRTAWLLDPADPQNAYRLIAHRSAETTRQDVDRALETLASLERGLIRRERPGAAAAFTEVRGIIDDAGGAMAFVPAAYAGGFSLILQGELERGLDAFRAAITNDPLVTDPASRSEPMVRGISALRQAASAKASAPGGMVAAAVEELEAAVAAARNSSEAHRILATAYLISGDIARSVEHLRNAVRLNPRDERSQLALARTLEETGRSAEAEDVLRKAIVIEERRQVGPLEGADKPALASRVAERRDLPGDQAPSGGALRWRLSTMPEKLQRADDADPDLLAMADRFVLLVGKGELYRALARLAQLHLDYEQAVGLLQRAVSTTPNNAAAHKALGRAYVDNGRETEAYAELVIALLLAPDDVETLTELGRLHLAADREERVASSVEALERAVKIDPTNRLALRALADALIRAGKTTAGTQRLEESERLQAKAIEDDRRAKAAAVLRLNAEIRRAEQDYAGAIDLWRQAISLQGGSAAIHLRLAEALAAANRPGEAVAEYRTAISLEAGADAHRRLAELYEAMGLTAEGRSERATHVERRLEELRRRAEEGAYGL
jgi:tetratricopeptide (TPR) repeat protein